MTTQVLLNVNYGGYSLSDECIKRLTELLNESSSSEGTVYTFDQIYCAFVYNNSKPGQMFIQEEIDSYVDNKIPFRSHPLLLQVINELGIERCALCRHGHPIVLKLREVPTVLLKYSTINEHDGAESIDFDFQSLFQRNLDLDVASLSHGDALNLLHHLKTLSDLVW